MSRTNAGGNVVLGSGNVSSSRDNIRSHTVTEGCGEQEHALSNINECQVNNVINGVRTSPGKLQVPTLLHPRKRQQRRVNRVYEEILKNCSSAVYMNPESRVVIRM